MLKIEDIAKRAGVSISTVSNVLNGKHNVGEETRRKVLQLCEEMDYRPNPAVKKNKIRKKPIILFCFREFDKPYLLKILQGFNSYVIEKGYELLICTGKNAEHFMNINFTSGCVVLDDRCMDSILVKNAEKQYPIVVLDRLLEIPYIKSVIVNNYMAEKNLIKQLIDIQYKSFAFLGGPETEDSKERYKAFLDVLEANNIVFHKENYYEGDYTEKSGYQFARLLMLHEDLPEILVCANDEMALGAMKAFKENGIKIPEDISICGFDDIDMAEKMGLTTVSIPNFERGYLAAQYLIKNIEGAPNYETFLISTKVKWRSSTRSPIEKTLF